MAATIRDKAAVVSNNAQTTSRWCSRELLGRGRKLVMLSMIVSGETVRHLDLVCRGRRISFHDETVIGLADDIALAISTSINKRGSWTHSTHSQTAASRRLWLERLSQYSALRLTANR
jgi:hypothetical protein